jgi:acetyl-CoA carboxylase biotin carboxyl carrier protein
MLRDRIMELVSLLKREDLSEIEVRSFWSTIRVARSRGAGIEGAAVPEPSEKEAASTAVAAIRPAETAAAMERAKDEPAPEPEAKSGDLPADQPEAELMEIVSPMVGTFYKASGPEAEPYVKIGQQIEIGQVICMIEAMKLMNEIESEASGIVRKVLVKDSQPVEFGQPLFLIESA